MRYEITLNGKVYEVEVDDNRALLGAIESARPLSDEELAEHPALARRMVSNITRAANTPRPIASAGAASGPRRVPAGTPLPPGAVPINRPAARPGAPAAAAPVVKQPVSQAAAPSAASAAAAAPAAKGEPVSAPMPGLIKEIKVQPGEQVKAGQVLIILEAMKMENEIVAPSAATVTAVTVSKGQTVSAGAQLLSLAK